MIRQATPNDMPYIIELYRKGLEEIGEKNIKDSLLLKKVVNSYQLAPCFVLEVNGNIVGIAGLTVVISSHSGDASLDDYMLYVQPEHRNIKSFGALVKAVKEFAEDKEMPLRIEFSTNLDEKLRTRLLKMHGFSVTAIMGAYNA